MVASIGVLRRADLDLTLGIDRCRASDWQHAIESLRRATAGSAACQATAHLFLALTYQQSGERELANDELIEAERIMTGITKSKFSWWHEDMAFRIVLAEVRKELDLKASHPAATVPPAQH